jgi:nucleoid DNA-binding protein
MTPADLIAEIAKSNDLKAGEAKRIIAQIAQVIIDSAKKGEEVTFPGLGTFKIKTPPSGKKLVLVQSKKLKEALGSGA